LRGKKVRLRHFLPRSIPSQAMPPAALRETFAAGDLMASQKKRRKAIKLNREQKQPPTGPFRHKDGDRRHRGGLTADKALANKRAMQQLGAPLPRGSDEEE
jgi:hypothetical protein